MEGVDIRIGSYGGKERGAFLWLGGRPLAGPDGGFVEQHRPPKGVELEPHLAGPRGIAARHTLDHVLGLPGQVVGDKAEAADVGRVTDRRFDEPARPKALGLVLVEIALEAAAEIIDLVPVQ